MARDEEIEVIETREDGSWVTSDGEILTVPEGTGDRLAYAVAQMRVARDQIKAWSVDAMRWQAVILATQETKTAVYGDVVADRRQNPITAYDPIPMAATAGVAIADFAIKREAELPDGVLRYIENLIACATGFDVDRLETLGYPEFVPLAKRKPTGALTRPWIDVRTVKRLHRG